MAKEFVKSIDDDSLFKLIRQIKERKQQDKQRLEKQKERLKRDKIVFKF